VGPPGSHAQLAEESERIGRAVAIPAESIGLGAVAAVHTHFPGGTVAGDRFLLIPGNRVLAHPGEEIVRLIVFADVLEAETPVFPFAQPPLGGSVRRAFAAPRPVAARSIGAHAPILAWLDPDAVEQGRTDLHGRRLCGPEGAGRKLDKCFSLVPSTR